MPGYMQLSITVAVFMVRGKGLESEQGSSPNPRP